MTLAQATATEAAFRDWMQQRAIEAAAKKVKP